MRSIHRHLMSLSLRSKRLLRTWGASYSVHMVLFCFALYSPVPKLLNTLFVLFTCFPGNLINDTFHLIPRTGGSDSILGVGDIQLSLVFWALFHLLPAWAYARLTLRSTALNAAMTKKHST